MTHSVIHAKEQWLELCSSCNSAPVYWKTCLIYIVRLPEIYDVIGAKGITYMCVYMLVL